MFKPELADRIHQVLQEKKSFLRLSSATKLLEEDPDVVAETIRTMKQIRPDLFDVIMANELIITINESYAYEANTWKRNGGFINYAEELDAEINLQVHHETELAPVFAISTGKAMHIDHEWADNIALLSVKICAIAVFACMVLWYLDRY